MRDSRYGDLAASVVVLLVAVPLCLGIAAAVGAPLAAGLVGAVVGGIVAGALGGSAVVVTGPATGLTMIVAQLIGVFGWRATCMITVLAGVVQLALGGLRVARAALAVSPAVVYGMLAGVGIGIAAGQFHVVLGGTPHSSIWANLRHLPGRLLIAHDHSVLVALVTLAVLMLWPRVPGRFPAPLAALAAATGLSVVFGWDVGRVTLPDDPLGTLAGPVWPHADLRTIAAAVLSVALVASVESLLCAVAVDRLHSGRRVELDRELAGQGGANIVSGLLGGLPLAGGITRSTAGVAAGARTRLATMLHGGWVLLVVLVAVPAIELIPLPALAALLVYTGLKMVDFSKFRGLRRHGETPAYLVTVGVIMAFGMIEGVLAGLICAAVTSWRRLACLTVRGRHSGSRYEVFIDGSLTCLGVPKVTRALREARPGGEVVVNLNVDFIDDAAVTAVHDWKTGHERTGGTVELHGSTPVRKAPPPRWWAPWGDPGTGSAEALLTRGTERYHDRTAPLLRPMMLAAGQRPSHLFITCADSRIVPNLITASGPGDLFTVRNIGNLVPRHGTEDSVAAAIEYATEVLAVRNITVCGHSGCGAMSALLADPRTLDDMPGLRRWLGHGEAETDDLTALCQANVVRQLENLLTHPGVRRRVTAGELELSGMYFDLATAELSLLDEGVFRPCGPDPRHGARWPAGSP